MVSYPAPVALAAILFAGCVDSGAGTPAGSLASYVEALAGGDRGAAYDLLDSQVRGDLDGLHAALRATAALVRSEWPASEQQALMERAGASLAERTESPREYLGALLGGEEGFRLSRLATWGARPVSVEASDGAAQVSTLAGDTFSLVLDDGAWRVAPTEALAASLRDARRIAEANLESLRAHRGRTAALRKGLVRAVP